MYSLDVFEMSVLFPPFTEVEPLSDVVLPNAMITEPIVSLSAAAAAAGTAASELTAAPPTMPLTALMATLPSTPAATLRGEALPFVAFCTFVLCALATTLLSACAFAEAFAPTSFVPFVPFVLATLFALLATFVLATLDVLFASASLAKFAAPVLLLATLGVSACVLFGASFFTLLVLLAALTPLVSPLEESAAFVRASSSNFLSIFFINISLKKRCIVGHL